MMLRRISNDTLGISSLPSIPEQYKRNELEDMKQGIEYLYEFKNKLSKLHPVVQDALEHMLQVRNHY